MWMIYGKHRTRLLTGLNFMRCQDLKRCASSRSAVALFPALLRVKYPICKLVSMPPDPGSNRSYFPYDGGTFQKMKYRSSNVRSGVPFLQSMESNQCYLQRKSIIAAPPLQKSRALLGGGMRNANENNNI